MKKQNTKKATKKVASKRMTAFAVGSHEGQIFTSVPYTLEDFKNSLLVVSLGVNMVILVLWLLVAVSNDHAATVARLILR